MTEAERLLRKWQKLTKTASLTRMAEEAGALRESGGWSVTSFLFSDGSVLDVKGRGRNEPSPLA